jgi:hypothetical protein
MGFVVGDGLVQDANLVVAIGGNGCDPADVANGESALQPV